MLDYVRLFYFTIASVGRLICLLADSNGSVFLALAAATLAVFFSF